MVGCRPHGFGDHRLLVGVRAVRVGQALVGEDDQRRGCVGVLDDVGAVGRGDHEVTNRRFRAVDQAMGTGLAATERDHRPGRQDLRPVGAA